MLLRKKNTKDFVDIQSSIKTVMFTAVLLASAASFGQAMAQNEITKQDASVKLDTSSHKVITIDSAKPEIKPGESQVQREAREKAEAEAKAKAEAAAAAAARNTISRGTRIIYSDPSDFVSIYKRAEAAYGVDWKLLNAIHYVETGASGSTYKANPSGATGPMQFLPSTFRRHGVDGNGDGIKDIGNVEDAIFSAAAYLKACGYPDVKKALWGYNPSSSYYNKVMSVMNGIQ